MSNADVFSGMNRNCVGFTAQKHVCPFKAVRENMKILKVSE